MPGEERPSFLCLIFALISTTVQCATEAYDIAKNLKCHTDYSTEIDCQWVENAKAREYIPMELHYRKETESTRKYPQQKCNSRKSPGSGSSSVLNWRCTIEDDNYAVSFRYNYVFKPVEPVNLSKSFRPLANIKPQPPFNLSLANTVEGDYLLSWLTIYTRNSSNRLFGRLQYEINYKRSWDSWENSAMEAVQEGSQQIQISRSLLVDSETYVARVRAKPQQQEDSRGHWSEWSSEIQWETSANSYNLLKAKPEVMPRNLMCFYDGIQEIECTWEITRESSKYFQFSLHYGKANSSETKECENPGIMQTFKHLTVHRCSIPVNEQEAMDDYEVFLKIVEPSVVFKPYINIKPKAPFNLTIKQLPDERYQLDWLAQQAQFNSEYEIHYKKAGDSWENFKVLKIPQDTKSFQIQKNSLEASSHYVVRVRAKVKCRQDPHSYCGPWSDWSKEVSFKTEPDNKIIIIAAVIILMVLTLFVRPFFCLIQRKKKSWLESIPDPAKSKLFLKQNQTGILGYLVPVGTVTLEEGNICQVVPDGTGETSPQVISKEEATSLQIEKEKASSSPLLTRSQDALEQLYPAVGANPSSQDGFSNFPMFPSELSDYNGPYLFNYQAIASGSEFCSEFNHGCEKRFECVTGPPGYVKLPGESLHLVQANDGPTPPVPSSAYVLNAPQPSPDVPDPAGCHIGTGNAMDATLSQLASEQQPSLSSYVLCPPVSGSSPTFPREAHSGYVRENDAGQSTSSQAHPWVDVMAYPPASQRLTGPDGELETRCFIPTAGDESTQGWRSHTDGSQETQSVTPQQPPNNVNYVCIPPSDLSGPSHVPPEQALLSADGNTSLSSDHQQAVDFTWTTAINNGVDFNYPPEHQVDSQKSPSKEDTQLLTNMQNDTPVVILYQQGGKPLILKQIGDYCFIPGSRPANPKEPIKCHPATDTEPAKEASVWHEGFNVMPCMTSNKVAPPQNTPPCFFENHLKETIA
ncbi:cytokine receptor common subunit beta-like [Stegostoma tigrinum]|uniref:cytokine receptor common subunit beta-like n=1 Tax=Stegostoma tigrinum TaxID=3053191 RepID=UPI00202B3201|nr:cytokine receptor common subunit beta-like [Stegostoma tigrinum]XP_048376910.1 cytokine receptor common subunit beta-like [Stegostoma tigrinum]